MNPLYRDQTELFTADTVLTGCLEVEGRTALLVRDLLFYPGGGGQPPEVTGSFVTLRDRRHPIFALVKHRGDVLVVLTGRLPEHDTVRKGESARQDVDPDRRRRAAAYHTAQHALGGACRLLFPGYETRGMEIAPDLDRCTMHFQSTLPPGETTGTVGEDMRALVEAGIHGRIPVSVQYFPSVEAIRTRVGAALRLDPTLPPFKGNRLRTVLIGAEQDTPMDASLCGGTHLGSLASIGAITDLEVAFDPHTELWRCAFQL